MTAPAYGCQLQGEGEQHQVSWLITHLNPAGTISLCDDDFAIGVIHLLATDLGTDPERLYDAVKRHVDREAARAAKAAGERTKARQEAGLPGDGSELDSDGPYTGPNAEEQAAIDAVARLREGTGQ